MRTPLRDLDARVRLGQGADLLDVDEQPVRRFLRSIDWLAFAVGLAFVVCGIVLIVRGLSS